MEATSPDLNRPKRTPVLWVNMIDPDDKGDWFPCTFSDEADAIDDVAQGRHGYRFTTVIFDNGDTLYRNYQDAAEELKREWAAERAHNASLLVAS